MEKYENEIWKPIEGFNELYKISNKGNFYSSPRNTTKGGYNIWSVTKQGYLEVSMCKNGKIFKKTIHRLVYETFVGPISEGYVVHHKNHNKLDNRVENLELLTREEHNIIHSNAKTIKQYTKTMEYIAEYKTAADAERKTGVKKQNILSCCQGIANHSTAGGFVWKYKDADKKV